MNRTKGQWYAAMPPLCRPGTGLTPADWFGRTMIDYVPENVTIGVINVAVGGTKIEGFMNEYVAEYIAGEADWFKNYMASYNNEPFTRLVEMAKRAQNYGVIKGILLHQGESNNGDGEWCNKVKTVYERLLAELGLYAENVPLLAGEMVRQDKGGICYGHNSVIATLPQVVPSAYVISSADCNAAADGLHFTADGYRLIGKRYALQMLKLMGYNVDNVSPIEKVQTCANQVVDVKVFDVTGRSVGADYRGIALVHYIYADGHVATEKKCLK
ncbi:MAG: sialate O-acetylesterase [Bacteroidales bacterium]|nr:sialate O-acetylesterase [Bacteroidales bacterium]